MKDMTAANRGRALKALKKELGEDVIVLNAFHRGEWLDSVWVTSTGFMYRYGKEPGIKSKTSMHLIGTGKADKGYRYRPYTIVHDDGSKTSGYVHRCVWYSFWQAFKEGKCNIVPKFYGFDPDTYTGDVEGHHIDRNPDNNAIDNIEFMPKELHNMFHEFSYKEDYEAYKKYVKEHPDGYAKYLSLLTSGITEPTLIIDNPVDETAGEIESRPVSAIKQLLMNEEGHTLYSMILDLISGNPITVYDTNEPDKQIDIDTLDQLRDWEPEQNKPVFDQILQFLLSQG